MSDDKIVAASCLMDKEYHIMSKYIDEEDLIPDSVIVPLCGITRKAIRFINIYYDVIGLPSWRRQICSECFKLFTADSQLKKYRYEPIFVYWSLGWRGEGNESMLEM